MAGPVRLRPDADLAVTTQTLFLPPAVQKRRLPFQLKDASLSNREAPPRPSKALAFVAPWLQEPLIMQMTTITLS